MKNEHDGQRFCKRCLQWKTIDNFYQRSKDSPYKHGYCKACHKFKNIGAQKIQCPHCGHHLKIQGVDEKGNVVKKMKRKRTLKPKVERSDPTVKPIKSVKDFL